LIDEVAPARRSEGSHARCRTAPDVRAEENIEENIDEHSTEPHQGKGDRRNPSNRGCRNGADKALVAGILDRPSRSRAWRTAHGGFMQWKQRQ
jgi:hypothetical protein